MPTASPRTSRIMIGGPSDHAAASTLARAVTLAGHLQAQLLTVRASSGDVAILFPDEIPMGGMEAMDIARMRLWVDAPVTDAVRAPVAGRQVAARASEAAVDWEVDLILLGLPPAAPAVLSRSCLRGFLACTKTPILVATGRCDHVYLHPLICAGSPEAVERCRVTARTLLGIERSLSEIALPADDAADGPITHPLAAYRRAVFDTERALPFSRSDGSRGSSAILSGDATSFLRNPHMPEVEADLAVVDVEDDDEGSSRDALVELVLWSSIDTLIVPAKRDHQPG